MKTTSTAANAAVAENTSTLLAAVNNERVMEKRAVKTITRPILMSGSCTKYRTRIAKVGSREEIMPLRTLASRAIRASL
jgi:hypothetical protein